MIILTSATFNTMVQVTKFQKYIEFDDANKELIASNPLQYFFLRDMFRKAVKKEQQVRKLFNISNGTNRIIVLHTAEVCLIYDDTYDETLIPVLAQELEFERFNKFQFAGSKRTIDKLFELHNATYQLQKHRVTYRCSRVNLPFTAAPGRMEMGNPNQLDELVALSQGFARDYYGEDKSYHDARALILSGIQGDSIYQWVDNGGVCAMAQTIDSEHDFPVIGHFYTNPADRNKGYGASLIHALTKGLLQEGGNEVVMLQTSALTPSSNRVFEKVGYQNVGEYLLAFKDK